MRSSRQKTQAVLQRPAVRVGFPFRVLQGDVTRVGVALDLAQIQVDWRSGHLPNPSLVARRMQLAAGQRCQCYPPDPGPPLPNGADASAGLSRTGGSWIQMRFQKRSRYTDATTCGVVGVRHQPAEAFANQRQLLQPAGEDAHAH